MKYQKYITVMQMAMGVTASNKDCLPVKRMLCSSHGGHDAVTPQDEDTSPSGAPGCSDGPTGASGGAMAISTLSLPMSQGKPSLRRIKGRIHRSKSLDSMDLLDSNVRPTDHMITPTCTLIDGQGEQAANNDYELVC
ncbi:hypothetical protein KUCAC02_001467 [Chaenocephalus aceratus]|uniref:Uncharacterized protein n=1 Tax=Chaenocephalus aceratus TaxID=36190 RepID=A0ACB9XRT7_CHAAC|nr:hypothetical protein KUCAC02_001467 [Chaenocephalus aceratus]